MKQQNEIKIIRDQEVLGKDFKVYGDIDEPLFLAKDVADMIEHSDVSKMVKSIDEDEKLMRTLFLSGQSRDAWFLTEAGLYEILFQSRKPIAKAFKKEVKGILKELRKTGVVITESATDEAIDFNKKYGKYRIRKTFTESTDIRATYEEYAALSKIERDCKRIDNKDRIRNCKAILDVIETRIAENVTTMRGSEVLALRELALDIQSDITKLHNKLNGGKKSAMTKRIQQLEAEDEIDFFDGSFYCIHRHSYTANRLTDVKDGRKVKAAGYKVWLSRLNLSDFIPEELPNVNFNEKLRLTLGFVSVQTMDLDNQIKAIQDALADYYDFDDLLIEDLRVRRIDTVDTYEQGKIYVKLENI